ncbi:hypothetical protein EDC01DRAFT_661395 [Geopyxis carbonaria]|nr:hypothetical protein EDC01DRAFT_661395 [Geopyxis carbonaria]
MPQTSKAVDAAVAAILSADLTPTEHQLLHDLVLDAVDSDHIARYILELIEQNSNESIENVLRTLKRDWRRLASKLTGVFEVPPRLQALLRLRDGPHCTLLAGSGISGPQQTEPVYIIPPAICDDPDLAYEGSLHSLLEAFLTPSKVSKMRNLLRSDSDEGALKNLLSLSPSIHSAFRNGHVGIRKVPGNMAQDWYKEDEDEDAAKTGHLITRHNPEACAGLQASDGTPFNSPIIFFTLHTNDPVRFCPPSDFLLRIHFRFSGSLHLFYIEDLIAQGWSRCAPALLSRNAQCVFRKLWLFVPKFARVWCYRGLLKAGRYFYGGPEGLAQRVPLGLYLKRCLRSDGRNESNALKLVERHTSVRVAPLFIDTFQHNGELVIVMTRVRGQQLGKVFHLMSYPERDQFADDLAANISQIRRIQNHSPYMFADTTGGPMLDYRIPGDLVGPFNSEADFNSSMIMSPEPELEAILSPAYSRKHRVFFTHSDLHCANLLVCEGRLSGIVDWECAAFKPEYWEYTKAIYSVWNKKPEEAMFNRAFGGKAYKDELAAEKALWDITPPWA